MEARLGWIDLHKGYNHGMFIYEVCLTQNQWLFQSSILDMIEPKVSILRFCDPMDNPEILSQLDISRIFRKLHGISFDRFLICPCLQYGDLSNEAAKTGSIFVGDGSPYHGCPETSGDERMAGDMVR